MNAHDRSWRQIQRAARDRVIIIRVRPWMEGVALACGLLMVMGLLELVS